ncbi:MAG: hypothetical protein VKJ04_11160 [Vampirovibrionales bacterium]|nr:hypothetical protein [Vampirovibrionales bacterium]
MLIVLPSTPTTQKASEYLHEKQVPHDLIPIPDSLGYKTGSEIGIYIESEDHTGVPMELTRERFVVMRVFKDFKR